MTALRISEVAAQTGFSPSTLRYYEEVGLLPELERSAAGYRVFDERSVRRLALIARAKQLGLSLDEISELASIWDGDECAPVQERLVTLVSAKASDARYRSGQLEAFADELDRAVSDLRRRTAPGACDDDCGCTSPLADDGSIEVTISIGRAPLPDHDQPIACKLAPTTMSERLDDWRSALRDTTNVVRDEGRVRFELAAGTDVAELARLAAAEQGCCSFLTFGLSIDGHGVTLEIRGPRDAAPMLDAFVERSMTPMKGSERSTALVAGVGALACLACCLFPLAIGSVLAGAAGIAFGPVGWATFAIVGIAVIATVMKRRRCARPTDSAETPVSLGPTRRKAAR